MEIFRREESKRFIGDPDELLRGEGDDYDYCPQTGCDGRGGDSQRAWVGAGSTLDVARCPVCQKYFRSSNILYT